MRKVLGSHAQTAHVWAQNNQSEGRSSDSRMFFERGTIYSYGRHFAIASHVKDIKGNAAVLFTTDSYSPSTGKHISLTRGALRGDCPVYYVPEAQAGYETKNLEMFDKQTDKLLEKYAAPRIRQTTRDGIASQIARNIESRNTFGFAFVKRYKPVTVPDDINALAKSLTDAKAKAAASAERAKKKAQEESYKLAEAALKASRGQWADLWRLNKWHLIQTDDRSYSLIVSSYIRQTHGILLRVKGDIIETSQGAEFPLEHGLKALPFIRAVKAKGETWHKNGKTIHLGHFQIDSIEGDGTIKAGCHTVPYSEVELIAQRLGV